MDILEVNIDVAIFQLAFFVVYDFSGLHFVTGFKLGRETIFPNRLAKKKLIYFY